MGGGEEPEVPYLCSEANLNLMKTRINRQGHKRS